MNVWWEDVHIHDTLQYANKESAVASTLAPRAASSAVVYSAELWERPATLGTNSIAVGRCRAMI